MPDGAQQSLKLISDLFSPSGDQGFANNYPISFQGFLHRPQVYFPNLSQLRTTMDTSAYTIDPEGEVIIILRNANSPFAQAVGDPRTRQKFDFSQLFRYRPLN